MSIRAIVVTACGLAAALCPAAAGLARTSTVAAATAGQDDLEASRAAVAEIDIDRLTTDRNYAAEILGHLDRIAADDSSDSEIRAAVDSLRLIALTTLERRAEVRSTVERVLARRPRDVDAYGSPIYAASQLRESALLVTAIEAASRNVPGVGWPDLRSLIDPPHISALFGRLRRAGDPALRLRLAEALFRIGWTGDDEVQLAEFIRSILMDDRLARGDVQAAAGFAAGLTSPNAILPLLVQPRYDEVVAPGRDRLDVLRQALAELDRTTAEALAEAPRDARSVIDRSNYLQTVGRNEEAVALVAPLLRDPAAAATVSQDRMWLINEAAYGLVALGRHEEALTAMSRLLELPLAEHSYLISASINHGELLNATGRHAEALDHATRLQNEAGNHASDYGDLWIAAEIVCSLARLGRAAEAAPQLERMQPLADANPAALTEAYLCLGDDEAAAALMIRRLESDDPGPAILALQDYSLSRGAVQSEGRYDRLTALRERPDVRAALARVGRLLTLPLARGNWGNF